MTFLVMINKKHQNSSSKNNQNKTFRKRKVQCFSSFEAIELNQNLSDGKIDSHDLRPKTTRK